MSKKLDAPTQDGTQLEIEKIRHRLTRLETLTDPAKKVNIIGINALVSVGKRVNYKLGRLINEEGKEK